VGFIETTFLPVPESGGGRRFPDLPDYTLELAKGLLRKKIPELQLALEGKLEQHHRFLLELQLQRLEAAEKDLAALQQRIQQKLEPYGGS
jgi:transposase